MYLYVCVGVPKDFLFRLFHSIFTILPAFCSLPRVPIVGNFRGTEERVDRYD